MATGAVKRFERHASATAPTRGEEFMQARAGRGTTTSVRKEASCFPSGHHTLRVISIPRSLTSATSMRARTRSGRRTRTSTASTSTTRRTSTSFAICSPGTCHTTPTGKAPSADEELTGYYTQNSQFSWLDSRALFVLLQAWRPQRIIEVGSGYSSLLMADINERLLDRSCRITCIEPYPRPFLQRPIAGLSEVIVQKVQEVPLETFESLEAGDILFIDSSHVSKTGSDVNYLYFEVLPRLRDGVRIHIHDIFLPSDYPKEWVLQDQRSWNEQYLLRALLMHSHGFVIEFGCNYAWFRFQDEVSRALAFADGRAFGGGSIWLRRTRS
jgi:predicted O-methyltransferase YrrM